MREIKDIGAREIFFLSKEDNRWVTCITCDDANFLRNFLNFLFKKQFLSAARDNGRARLCKTQYRAIRDSCRINLYFENALRRLYVNLLFATFSRKYYINTLPLLLKQRSFRSS